MNTDTSPGVGIRERRLAAIMFTDVTGYSARTQRDEEGTLDLVGADLKRMSDICARHGGEVLTTMGDGMLICFTSTVRAVACALEIQAEFAARKESMPADQCLEHRIGIHLGDIFVRDGNVAGDGVNIAARLQTKAPPGGICISQTVHDTVKGKLAMQSVFIGPQSFKNIAEPITVYHLSPEGSPSTVPPMPPPADASKEGRFMRRRPGGGRALSPAAWALAVAVVVACVAAWTLRPIHPPVPPAAVPLPTGQPAPARAPAPTVSSLVTEARSFFTGADAKRQDYLVAESLLKKAVAADPADASAWASYSELDSSFFRNNVERSRERMEAARTMAERASTLAPDLFEGFLALGQAERLREGNLLAAEQTFRLALTRDPSSSAALGALAETLRAEGRLQEALDLYAHAGPLLANPAENGAEAARTLFDMRRFEEADAAVEKSLAARATVPALGVQTLLDLTWRGDAGRAVLSVARVPTAAKGSEETAFLSAYAQLVARRPDAALEALHAYPGSFFTGSLFFGPKAYLTGVAHSRLNEKAEAQADWEAGLADVRKRIQTAPRSMPLRLSEGLLLASLGRLEEALKDARMVAGRPLQEGLAPSWMQDPAVIFCALGRDPEALSRIEHLVATPSVWPLTPQLLDSDPIWDSLRDKPRFKRLSTRGGAGK